jgi:hypothetical protein
VALARNIAVILVLAALVAFLPGGGDAAAVIGAVLSTLIIASFVLLAARWYREHRLDLEALGDRWRLILYGSIGTIVLALAATRRLFDAGGLATLVWIIALGGSAYALYLVWRHSREYA